VSIFHLAFHSDMDVAEASARISVGALKIPTIGQIDGDDVSMQAVARLYGHAEGVKLEGGEAQSVGSAGEIAASPISQPTSP
jgi:hypothetical protein